MTNYFEGQHQDFIWTWKSNGRGAKVSIWLPYFSEVTKEKKCWQIKYNGGSIDLDLQKVDLIMFYGASGSLPLGFLDDLAKHNIIFMIHKRNQIKPYLFFPANVGDNSDVLSQQIIFRKNEIKKTYIARLLIRERFNKMETSFKVSDRTFYQLGKTRNVKSIRSIEANTTKIYWENWFHLLGVKGTRRGSSPISAALDAGSKFLYGVILRWILFHRLSPCHGFLHEPTDYPSLVYDLIEPYRYIIEDAVFISSKYIDINDSKKLTAESLENIKRLLEETVYVPATRQYVRRKNLLHGIVLALRSYLLNESKRFIIPTEGEKMGGRPPKIAYRLPGERRG